MKKNLEAPILNVDGSAYDDKPTLGSMAFAAVQAPLPSDQGMPVEKKMSLYRLAQKIVKRGVQDFTAEEISLIKERVGLALPPVLMGPVFDLLDTDFIDISDGEPRRLPIPEVALRAIE